MHSPEPETTALSLPLLQSPHRLAPGPPSGTRTQSKGLSGVDKLSTNGQELLAIRERFSKSLLCLDPAVASGLQDWAYPLRAAPPRSAEDTLMLRFGVWGLYFCPQLSQPSAPQPPHLGPPGHAPSSAAGARTPAGPGAPGLSVADLQTPCVTFSTPFGNEGMKGYDTGPPSPRPLRPSHFPPQPSRLHS